MKNEINDEFIGNFLPCGICGEETPVIFTTYRGRRGEYLFIVMCDFCGEFESFKVPFISDQNINIKAVETWNKKIGRDKA